MGQGNIFSAKWCKTKSSYIISKIE